MTLCLTLESPYTFSASDHCYSPDDTAKFAQKALDGEFDQEITKLRKWKAYGRLGMRYSWKSFLQLSELTLNILFPFFPFLLRDRKLRIILRKGLAGKELSDRDMRFLEKRGLTEKVSLFQQNVKEKRAFRYRKRAQAILYSWGMPLYAWLIAFLAFLDDEQQKIDTYEAMIADEVKNDEELSVDIILDYTFFPHFATRIGPFVYSFSKDRLEKWPLDKFLRMDISDLVNRNLSAIDKFKLFRRTFLAIRLRLSKEEINRLRDKYEQNLGLEYEYELLARDCSSMALEYLSEETSIHVPHYISGSPDATQTYLRLLQSHRVEKVTYFSQNPNNSAFEDTVYRIRNAYIGSVEAKLHLFAAPFYIYHNEIASQEEVVWMPESGEKVSVSFLKRKGPLKGER